MGTVPWYTSIPSLLKMKAHDQKEYWIMKQWFKRGHKVKKDPTTPFSFY